MESEIILQTLSIAIFLGMLAQFIALRLKIPGIILLMGFVSSLPVLLILRLVQGILGGISTVGLIIVSSSSSREWASRDIGLFQNSMTLG